MKNRTKAFIFLHVSVFLFGFTAILGELISVNYISVVWWRALFTSSILLFVFNFKDLFQIFSTKDILRHTLIGFLLAIHWLFFYGSIKLSNPTITLITLSSSSLITALIEPFVIKKSKWNYWDIIMGIMIIPGFLMIAYNSSEIQKTGILIGLVATLLGSFFSILNKKWLVSGHEFKLTFIQMLTVFVTVSLFFLLFTNTFSIQFEALEGNDWFYMIIFSLFCTVIAYFLYLKSMNYISAFDVSVAFNMEPVYGIMMAAFILHDYKNLSPMVYLGMVFISIIVFLNTYLKSSKDKKLNYDNTKADKNAK